MSVYYHPKKNKIEIFQIDRTCPSMGVDFSWWEKGYGWSKTKKGVPEDYGWVHIGKTDFLNRYGKWIEK